MEFTLGTAKLWGFLKLCYNESVLHKKSPWISSVDMFLCTLKISVAKTCKYLVFMVTEPTE